MNIDHKMPVRPEQSSERYMNAYERAQARHHMEQAIALADWSVYAWGRVRTGLKRVGRVLRRERLGRAV
jgi:hypothetical protein